MARQRLFGTQLEILLAELMTPGRCNYNISRYVQFDGELDVPALIDAIETALSEAGIAHYDYEIDSDGAWRVSSEDGRCRVGVVDLRDTSDSMNRCRELMCEDTNRPVPMRGRGERVRHVIFALGECDGRSRWIWYQRCHHILADGFSLQRLLKRVAELYNALSSRSEPPPGDFLGYAELLEDHDSYVESDQHTIDRDFWNGYLTEYLSRSDGLVFENGEAGAEPYSRSTAIARGDGNDRLPIESIIAATMATARQASGAACQSVGMSFGRRNRPNLDRIVSPMVSILPLWIDMSAGDGRAAVEAQVGDAFRKVRKHQFYGGEQAIRDLGYTGRPGGLYLCTLNFRVYVSSTASFNDVDSALHFLASPFTGVDVTVESANGEVRLNAKSTYRSVYGMDVDAFVGELFGGIGRSVGAPAS